MQKSSSSILELLQEIVVQLLQYFKTRLIKVLFTIENLMVFFLLFILYGYCNAILFEILPFSEIWWDPVASGYGLIIGIIRNFWHNAILTPGTLYFHIRVVTHCYLAVAPASAILVVIFASIALMQGWFFVCGLLSDDPNDLRFFHFWNKNRFLLFGLLFIETCIIGYFLSYNPTFPGACGGGGNPVEGLKSVSEPLTVSPFTNNCIDFGSILDFSPLPASPACLMEGLIALHSDIWAIMLFTGAFMLYMIYSTLYNCYATTTIKEHSLIEIIWTTIPAVILCILAIPYFLFSYSLDEMFEPSLTIKAIGFPKDQWYWSYEYGDYEVCDGLVTNNLVFNSNILQGDDHINQFMASPQESTNSWFSSIKSWWNGPNNQALSPLETNQKTLSHLHKTQTATLGQCKQHDDMLVDGSMTPRSKAVVIAKREECYFHYNSLSKCINQVSLDVARTQYEASPSTFSSAFGHALGDSVGQATKPIYMEMAKHAVTSTADSLQSSDSQ